MRVLTSSTQTAEELTEALTGTGMTVVPSASNVANSIAFNPNPSAPPDKPGDSPQPPEGETVPPSEAGKDTPQDTQAAPEPPEKPQEAKPERGNFESRRKQLERQKTRLQEDLDLERDSKSQLQAKLEAAEAELAKLKPAVEVEKKDEGPVKPKRPTLADNDYDNEKYEAALNQYEDKELPAYYKELSIRTVREENAKAESDRKAQEAKKAADEAFDSFVERKDAGIAHFEDWEDLSEQIGGRKIDLPDAIELAMLDSENPADLIHHFMDDVVNQDGKDLKRFQQLSPIRQVKELTKLEERLVKEREARVSKPVAESAVTEPAAAVVAPPEKPVKPQIKKPPVEPITPVGSRAASSTASLKDADGNMLAYAKLRAQGVNR